ncbi:DNA-primase RepB domain-containing protein [Paludibaculum fermentans]|uniref:DNA-primase RepB domain-containing protein n=1 Tax=Paludibaculum fermentans TaxID=1473598 RepID=UPI003EBD7084
MLDTFTSVGAQSFVVTKTDLLQGLKWGKTYSAQELREKLPAMVRTAATRRPFPIPDDDTVPSGENLIIRPMSQGVAFVQLDDLKEEQLERIRPAVFIIHATSPGSYQGWIAVSGVPEGKEQFKELMRRVRKAVGGNDKSASHATRVAGTENFKPKYAPEFPTVTIVETHPGRVMTPDQLESLGLLASPEPVKAVPLKFTQQADRTSDKTRQWPSYERSLSGAPTAPDGNGPDRSKADFWFSYLALQRGWSAEDTEAKLLEVSEKARERERLGDTGYVHVTVTNASAWLERNRQRTRA